METSHHKLKEIYTVHVKWRVVLVTIYLAGTEHINQLHYIKGYIIHMYIQYIYLYIYRDIYSFNLKKKTQKKRLSAA